MTYYIPIIMLFVVLFIVLRRRKLIVAKKIIERKNTEEKTKMVELAKRFIGKECIIHSFDNGHQFTGVIKEVVDGAVLIEKNGEFEAVNLDFVLRDRKSVV